MQACAECGHPSSYRMGQRELNGTRYELCSARCLKRFDARYPRAVPVKDKVVEEEEEPRKGADEQRGWKFHRWKNQAIKRKKAVWEQFKTDQEFKRIQRKTRRKHD